MKLFWFTGQLYCIPVEAILAKHPSPFSHWPRASLGCTLAGPTPIPGKVVEIPTRSYKSHQKPCKVLKVGLEFGSFVSDSTRALLLISNENQMDQKQIMNDLTPHLVSSSLVNHYDYKLKSKLQLQARGLPRCGAPDPHELSNILWQVWSVGGTDWDLRWHPLLHGCLGGVMLGPTYIKSPRFDTKYEGSTMWIYDIIF